MKNLKKQYDQISSKRKELKGQINVLLMDENVKKYFKLCNQNNELLTLQRDLFKQIKVGEYSSCKHIWVNTLDEYDSWEGRSHNYCGCVKCGLDKRVFHLMERFHNSDWLTLDQKIMYDFMKNNSYKSGIDTKLLCDLDLATAIYMKIIEVHPDIDDETAVKYLDTKVSDERKVSRAKRLSLGPTFNKWTGDDVSC